MQFNKSKFNNNSKRIDSFEFSDTSVKPDFPVEVFPPVIQTVINGMYKKAGFEKPMLGGGILYVISVITGNRITLPLNSTWLEHPNLWLVIVGQTGTMKTPVMKFAKSPVNILENSIDEQNKVNLNAFLEEVAAWEATSRDTRGVKPRKPGERHYITMDTTVEGLIHALKSNPHGISIYKDELSGFFKDMNRYSGGGGDEAFYLSAWGNDSYSKIRKTEVGTWLPKVTVSIFGGVQPKILNSIALTGTDNGMIYRFLYVVSDNIIRDFKHDGNTENEKKAYLQYFKEILGFIGDEEFELSWDSDSTRVLFYNYINKINQTLRDDNTSEHMRAYLRKLQVYLARFTIILSVMHKSKVVTEQILNRAALLVEYFMITGKATFDGLENERNIEAIFRKHKAVSKTAKIKALLTELPDMRNADIANAAKADKGQVSRVRKQFKTTKVDKTTLNSSLSTSLNAFKS